MSLVSKILKSYIDEINRTQKHIKETDKNEILINKSKKYFSSKNVLKESHLRNKYISKIIDKTFDNAQKSRIPISYKSENITGIQGKTLLKLYIDNDFKRNGIVFNEQFPKDMIYVDFVNLMLYYIGYFLTRQNNKIIIGSDILKIVPIILSNYFLKGVVQRENKLKLDENNKLVFNLFYIMCSKVFLNKEPSSILGSSVIFDNKVDADNSMKKIIISKEMNKIEDIFECLDEFGLIENTDLSESLVRMIRINGPHSLTLLDTENSANIILTILMMYFDQDAFSVLNSYSKMEFIINKKNILMKPLFDALLYHTLS